MSDLEAPTMTTDYDVVNMLREYHYDPVLVDAANEIEALRNERDFLVEEYERAVGCGPQGYTHAAIHLFNAITNAQADQNAKVIVALRAEVERLTGCLATANANHEQFERQWYLERDRAERLAEALREAADMLLADYPETAKRLRALLPTAAQENGDA